MKTDIEIVTGFIGSGKTKFINALLESTLSKNEKVIVVQLETGETEIERKFKEDSRVRFTTLTYGEFSEKRFSHILQRVAPHRVIIEFNGTEDINELLEVIHCKEIRKFSKLTSTYFISEAATLQSYLSNMGRFLIPCIQLSNLVVINNTKCMEDTSIGKVKEFIKEYKEFVPVLEVKDIKDIKETVKYSKLFHRGILKTCDVFLKDLLK